MSSRHSLFLGLRPQVSFFLLSILLAILLVSGGASRADVVGQTVARFAAWGMLAIAAICAVQPDFRTCRSVGLLVLGCVALPTLQLIPLPQSAWASVSGRELFVEEYALAADNHFWRPLSISPGATLNALSSLIIPITILILMASIRQAERSWVASVLLFLIIASMLIGLLQFSAAGFANPLVNYIPGMVSGIFANRNHFALLLALGCLIAPAWAFMRRDQLSWRIPLAMGVVVLAELTILATGSRAGMIIGVLSLILGPLIIREHIKRESRNTSRWVFPIFVLIFVATILVLVIISFNSGRAVSIDRFTTVNVGADMRSIGLPTVLEIIRENYTFGIGAGGFDAAFRISEPDQSLQNLYFNHVHNDWLEIMLEGGLLGFVLMIAAVLWWGKASFRVWHRAKSSSNVQIIGRLGSATILLVLFASAVDYPARTPLMMSVIVIAACWLAWGERATSDVASLPNGRRSL